MSLRKSSRWRKMLRHWTDCRYRVSPRSQCLGEGGGTHEMLARSEDSEGRRKRAGVVQSLPSKMESRTEGSLREHTSPAWSRQAQADTHGAWSEGPGWLWVLSVHHNLRLQVWLRMGQLWLWDTIERPQHCAQSTYTETRRILLSQCMPWKGCHG